MFGFGPARHKSGRGFFANKMTAAEQYQKERQRLERNRSLDWSSFAIEYIVAGEKLLPLTVQTWFDLMVVKSPVVTEETLTVEAVVDYVWRNSKKNTNNPILKEWRLFWLQRRIEKHLRKDATALKLVEVLKEHIKSSFDELPESHDGASEPRINKMREMAGEAALVDEIASRYSIHPREVLQMPLRSVFALQRAIRMNTIPDYKLLEPATLREIKSNYIKELNSNRDYGKRN